MLRNLAILAGLFVILGHMFPVWLRFKGGKGVATAFGVFLALCPLAALSALALMARIVALTRYVSLASILAAVVLPFLTLWLSPGRYGYASGAVVFVCCWMVIVKHRQNIVRLMQGTEHGFGARGKPEHEPHCHRGQRFLGNRARPEPGSPRRPLHCPVVSFGSQWEPTFPDFPSRRRSTR